MWMPQVAATYAEFDAFSERLRQRGFRDDGAVICRYRHPAGVVLDVMPIDAEVLGFGNRWYAEGVVTAGTLTLPSGAWIRVLRPPWLVATKLEAYEGRGRDDPMSSADFEDVVRLVDGREELRAEIAEAPEALRHYVATGLSRLADRRDFDESIEVALPPDAGSQARALLVSQRWRGIVAGAA